MKVSAIKTRPLLPPQDDLFAVIGESLSVFPEKAILSVTSKVVAIGEGRCEKIPDGVDARAYKHERAIEDSEWYMPRDEEAHGRFHTIVHGVLTGTAGIDESNGNGYMIRWPKDPMQSAVKIRSYLKEQYGVRDVGVVVTDSASSPLRNGATGIALGYAGFRAQYDYRGKNDIFGRPFLYERLNVVDSIACAANLVAGEGDECTPLCLIEDAPHVMWSDEESSDPFLALSIPMEEDLFRVFLKNAEWKKGGAQD